MNLKRFLIPLAAAAAICVVAVATPVPQSQEPMQGAEDTELTYADTLLNVAAEAYRNVKLLKTEAKSDAEYFPVVLDCYNSAMAALREMTPGTLGMGRVKSILMDLNPELLAGSFYYSNVGDQNNLSTFAQAYLDTQLNPNFRDERFVRDSNVFPMMAYIAASRAYNDHEYGRAIDYFRLYLDSGAKDHLEAVYLFCGQACLNNKSYDYGVATMRNALRDFPGNRQIAMVGIGNCVEGGHAEYLQEFLTPALQMSPDDEQLLTLQAKLYEDEREYQKALDIYTRLDDMSPNKLSTAKRIALCYYNIGVDNFNDAVALENEKEARKARQKARNYFTAASMKLEEVVASDPMSPKYLKSLGVCYLCIEDKPKFEEINRRLVAMGEDPLGDVFAPPMVTYNEGNKRNFDRVLGSDTYSSAEVPSYSTFGAEYITEGLEKWSRKGEFERMSDYQERVNDKTIAQQYEKLGAEARQKYIEQYGNRLRLSGLKLMPYDSTNEIFLIETSYGPIYLPVPLRNGEAERFKSNWEGVKFRNPQYYIADDQVRIAAITFQTPDGKSYSYDNKNAGEYSNADIDIDFGKILASNAQNRNRSNQGNASAQKVKITRESDVDTDIPQSNRVNANTFALVFANEDYDNVTGVESAIHDGEAFAKYCKQTLGIPEENVRLVTNATYGKMLGAMENMSKTLDAFGGRCDLIVYYAGHGMPDENTKDAYLLPTDGVPTVPATNYPLSKFYDALGAMKAQDVMVFLDACFSGAQRDGGMLHAARGVAIKAKDAEPKGSMFVLSAASGQETALPYKEMNHGLFTYFLLKKLQQSKGNATLKEISDYVITNVKRQSNVINQKPQTPTVVTSGMMKDRWTGKKLR